MSPHPEDIALVELVAGALSEAEALALERHLDACASCRLVVACLIEVHPGGDLGGPLEQLSRLAGDNAGQS